MKMELFGLFQVFIVYLFFATIQTDDLCDPVNGAPSNGEYCMLIPNYDTYQKAECGRPPFTTTSNKTETCIDECRNYCWLPCMVKEFDQHNGTVDPACACQGDRAQVCENATGSVTYYTECANATVPCPSPSYVDFAVFYFTWLSVNIHNFIHPILDDNGTFIGETPCVDTPIKKAFRLCVESNFQPLVKAGNNCSVLNGNFSGIFNQCLDENCHMTFRSGVDQYVASQPTEGLWPGWQNITDIMCP